MVEENCMILQLLALRWNCAAPVAFTLVWFYCCWLKKTVLQPWHSLLYGTLVWLYCCWLVQENCVAAVAFRERRLRSTTLNAIQLPVYAIHSWQESCMILLLLATMHYNWYRKTVLQRWQSESDAWEAPAAATSFLRTTPSNHLAFLGRCGGGVRWGAKVMIHLHAILSRPSLVQ